jgi:hypothetical protein
MKPFGSPLIVIRTYYHKLPKNTTLRATKFEFNLPFMQFDIVFEAKKTSWGTWTISELISGNILN